MSDFEALWDALHGVAEALAAVRDRAARGQSKGEGE